MQCEERLHRRVIAQRNLSSASDERRTSAPLLSRSSFRTGGPVALSGSSTSFERGLPISCLRNATTAISTTTQTSKGGVSADRSFIRQSLPPVLMPAACGGIGFGSVQSSVAALRSASCSSAYANPRPNQAGSQFSRNELHGKAPGVGKQQIMTAVPSIPAAGADILRHKHARAKAFLRC